MDGVGGFAQHVKDKRMERSDFMDYLELVEQLKNLEAIAYGYNINGEVIGMDCSDFEQIVVDSATAITDLLARAEKAEKERDAAVDHLRQMCVGGNTCALCKHGRNCGKQGPGRKSVEHCWEWCGQKEG